MRRLKILLSVFIAILTSLALFQAAPAKAQESNTVCIWDYNGDGYAPTSDLCSHGYDYSGITGTKSVTISEATKITSITFEVWYTSCDWSGGGGWSFYLNNVLIGTTADPDPFGDCSCNPAASKWPLRVTLADSALLNSLWQFGISNELKVVPSSTGFYACYHGATINYETKLHPFINPTYQAVDVGVLASFDASDSWSEEGTITRYDWNFGDGTTGSGITVSHAYSKQGKYTVTLTIEDTTCKIARTTATVAVTGPPQVMCVPAIRLAPRNLEWKPGDTQGCGQICRAAT